MARYKRNRRSKKFKGSGKQAGRTARKVYRQALKMPKKRLAKKYANTVGQIVRRSGGKISHGGYKKRRRPMRRRMRRR